MRAAVDRCGLPVETERSEGVVTETRLILSLLGPLLLLPAAASAQANFDACSLITRGEIEAVQGEPVTGTRARWRPRRLPSASTLATFSQSVSLEVARRDRGSPPRMDTRSMEQALSSCRQQGGRASGDTGARRSSSPLPVKASVRPSGSAAPSPAGCV